MSFYWIRCSFHATLRNGAYILVPNKIIGENDVIDAETLPKVKMPNRDGFISKYPEKH